MKLLFIVSTCTALLMSITASTAVGLPANPQNVDTASQNYGDNNMPSIAGAIFSGDYVLNTTADAQNFDYHLSSGSSISIEVPGNNLGTINIIGNTAFSQMIGNTTNTAFHLKALNANGAAGKTVSLGGNSSITTLNFGGDGSVTLADGMNFYGNITTGVNNQGTLSSLGSNTFNEGPIGTSSKKLKEVKGGADSKTSTFMNDIYATTFTVSGTGSVEINGSFSGTSLNFAANGGTVKLANGKTLACNVTTSNNGQGTLTFLGAASTAGYIGATGAALSAVNVNGGKVTLNNNIYATTTTVNSGGTLSLSNARSITGDLTLAGTGILDLGLNTLTLGGSGIYTQGPGTTLRLAVNGDTAAIGKIIASGNCLVNAASIVDVAVSGYCPENAAYKIVDGAGGLGVNVPATITDNSQLVSFTGSTSSGDLILTATRINSYDKVAANSNAAGAGTALESIGSSGASGDMHNILDALDSLSTTTEVAKALETLIPLTDGGVTTATSSALFQFVETTIGKLETVLTAAFSPSGGTGISTGDNPKNINRWGQGFGNYAHQSPRGASLGYNALVLGTAFGEDRPLFNDNTRAGASFGFANSAVRSKDNGGRTDINSYQLTCYGGYQNPGKPYYIESALSFAYNTYDSSRHIAIGNIARIANADYDGQQYSFLIGGGYTFKNGKLALTPITSLQYMHLDLDAYTEKNAESLNLQVKHQNYDMLQSSLGFKMEYPFELKTGALIPELHFRWLHDFINDKQATTATFTAGGGSFATSGYAPARTSYNFGAKVTLAQHNNWDFSFNYDYLFKKDYYAHSGVIKAKYSF